MNDDYSDDYGYDYGCEEGSAVYAEDDVMDRQISTSQFAPSTQKPQFHSRSERQTMQRVAELAHELGLQIGYENAEAECVAMLTETFFDVYKATQLPFEDSPVSRVIANGENNNDNYLVAWDDPQRGHLIANTDNCECATCFVDLSVGQGRAFCTHFMCKDCWLMKLNVYRTEWNTNTLVLKCQDVKKPTCLGMTCISKIEPELTTYLGVNFSNDFFPKHHRQWCRKLPDVSMYPGKTTMVATNADGKSYTKDFAHRRFVACATDECRNVFEVERDLFKSKSNECIVGKCSECLKRSCFLCQNKEHSPASCVTMAMWHERETDEGLNAQWVLVHTKQCPKCQTMIEKNEGCNHMTCRKCRHEFCWICMGLWSEHGNTYYKCNKPQSKVADQKAKTIQEVRSSLARYTHYYDRFRNHMNSVRLDEKTMFAVRQYVDNSFGGENVSYLEDVAKTLFDCRSTLANTYIYAYFETVNIEIFEFNQGQLEHATEELSRIVEICKRGKEIRESQQEVQNKASIAKKYLEILRQGI